MLLIKNLYFPPALALPPPYFWKVFIASRDIKLHTKLWMWLPCVNKIIDAISKSNFSYMGLPNLTTLVSDDRDQSGRPGQTVEFDLMEVKSIIRRLNPLYKLVKSIIRRSNPLLGGQINNRRSNPLKEVEYSFRTFNLI